MPIQEHCPYPKPRPFCWQWQWAGSSEYTYNNHTPTPHRIFILTIHRDGMESINTRSSSQPRREQGFMKNRVQLKDLGLISFEAHSLLTFKLFVIQIQLWPVEQGNWRRESSSYILTFVCSMKLALAGCWWIFGWVTWNQARWTIPIHAPTIEHNH